MKSHFISKVWSLVHSSGLVLMMTLASLVVSIPAQAQDIFQVDPQQSVAHLSLGSGQDAMEIGLARVSGQVVFDSAESADPSVSLKITPYDEPRSVYVGMSFTSERSALTPDGKLAVTGKLSVTRVERSVTMEPNEAYAGPQYGEPVSDTVTREITLMFSDPRRQASGSPTTEMFGTTSVSRETFPQFVDAVTAGDWPTALVDEEKCEQPSTIGEDYSGAACTADIAAAISNPAVIAGNAGAEDYSGFYPLGTSDHKQATMTLDLNLTELSTSGAGSATTQSTN
jgi:hypothetical protein